MQTIYLDHAATTPLDARVLEAMQPHLTGTYGNPSSVHRLGRKARFVIEECREEVAGMLGAEPGDILFTSGGTESDTTILLGGRPPDRPGLLTCRAEHKAVIEPARALEKKSVPVTWVEPDGAGRVGPSLLDEHLSDDVGLVSLMHVNNEIGTVNDVRALAEVAHEAGAFFHTDAVQSVGAVDLDVEQLGIDALSLSAHKFYGPRGAGVLYVRPEVDLSALIVGGSQERGRRGGTENVAAIVGLTTALRLAVEEYEERRSHLERLQSRGRELVEDAFGDRALITTPQERSAPHILHLAFPPAEGALDGEMLLLNMDMEGICVSGGSACTSGALEPSHVLQAIGLDRATASAAVRFSFGKQTTEEDLERGVEALVRVYERMVPVAG